MIFVCFSVLPRPDPPAPLLPARHDHAHARHQDPPDQPEEQEV